MNLYRQFHKKVIYRILKWIKNKKLTKQLVKVKCNFKWFGNDYGGFYICPDVFRNEEIIVYSIGIGEDASFDIDFMKEYKNCKIFAFDPTPKSIEWMKKQKLPQNFNICPYGISSKTGEQKMFLPQNKNHVSGSMYELEHLSKDDTITVKMKRIEDILREYGHEYVDIIKMDIEGGEFSVLENMNFKRINCGQIVLEFHEQFFKDGKELMEKAIKKLKNNNYCCFAISHSCHEYSFINTDIL